MIVKSSIQPLTKSRFKTFSTVLGMLGGLSPQGRRKRGRLKPRSSEFRPPYFRFISPQTCKSIGISQTDVHALDDLSAHTLPRWLPRRVAT